MKTYREKEGENPINLGTWVQEPPKWALPRDQPRAGLGTRGGGDPTAFSSESSNLGRRSQLLTWGKGWVGTSPTPAPARLGVPPRLALTEKAHAIPTRQMKTRTLLMAAFSRNSKTRRGLAFQLESTDTTPNHPHVCVHMGEWGEERLTSSHFLVGSLNPSIDPIPSFLFSLFFFKICLNFHEYILFFLEATKYQKSKFHHVVDSSFPGAGLLTPAFPLLLREGRKPSPTGDVTGAAGSTAHGGRPPTAPRPARALPREQCSWESHHRQFNLTEGKQTRKQIMEIIGFYSLPLAKIAVARHQCKEPRHRHIWRGLGSGQV